MNYYITYGDFQNHLTSYYHRTGSRMQFWEMMNFLYQKGLLSEEPLPGISPHQMLEDVSIEDVNRFIDSLVFTVNTSSNHPTEVMEADIIPNARDIFIIRHPRHTRPLLHRHNYFEMNYVASGECTFKFENSTRTLREGEFCMIAPESLHDLIIDDESTVLCIMVRRSTFNKTFLTMLSGKNLLSQFFRTFLSGENHTNYLLFFCQATPWLRRILFNAMLGCYKLDPYSNICCISWLNQLFAYLLRNYSKTVQFYDYQLGSEFSLVLQYIQHNYQNLTLSSLAEFFHYSEPYLCTLIKQNTGQNFTELIKDLRLSEAVEYLSNTNMSIGDIAEKIGYHSSDHFSRVFRSKYQMSPQKFRKEHQAAMQEDT
ncbi:MAG: AraC family transcriptional regulator, partial [Lachnospiraceae bacterium]|nr:AraC family transcriptional regulator [Lachnospiraceae bacterium]